MLQRPNLSDPRRLRRSQSMPIQLESLQRLASFADRGNGGGRHSKCCAIDTVAARILLGTLEAFADFEYAINNDGVDAFFSLKL